MIASKLKEIFEYLYFIDLNDRYRIYSDFEIYDTQKDVSFFVHSIDELLEYKIDKKTVSEMLDKIKFTIEYKGGRGAGSGSMGGGFGNAEGGGNGKDTGQSLPTAMFNNQGRFSSPEGAYKEFEKRYATAKIEYALSVDENGFVHSHKSGGSHSVYINAKAKNHTIIHNHPSGSNFSKADLKSLSAEKNAKGIIATGVKNGKLNRYSIEKSSHFDAKGFSKAVDKAEWPTKLSYDEGASWWLKKNQKKYGYKYSVVSKEHK